MIATADPAACPTQDLSGHGTHVAGTAAGDGSAGDTPYRYAGVAPEAELLVVKAGNGSFSEDRVIDGLVWIRNEARERGRPVVVNLSLGHQFGPHDGSTLFERMIDDLAGPGFIVVVSAGNEGANHNVTPLPVAPRPLIHARVQPVSGQPATVGFTVTQYTPSANRCAGTFIQFSVWYHVSDRVEVTVIRPNGTEHTVAAGAQGVSNDAAGRIEIYNANPLSAYPGTAEALIELNGCAPSGVPAPGEWQLRLRPAAQGGLSGEPVDIYLHTVVLPGSGTAFGTQGFDNRFVVGSPGTARRVITVGAFTTRTCWPSRAAASVCYTAAPEIGDLGIFSSGGPTRDGRIKPEVVAPGMGVMSSLSRHASAPLARVAPDGMHWVLEGTSMAAPHVAGTVALMLQHRPALAPEDVVDVLTRSARQDRFTTRTYDTGGGAPTDWWGFGKLDVPAALGLLLGGDVIANVAVIPPTDTLPQGGTRQLRAEAFGPDGETVFANFDWVSLHPDVATVTATGLVTGLQPGVARIVASAGVVADTATVVVQPPAVLAVSGQSAAPPAPALGTAGALLPLLAVTLQANGPEAIRVERLTFAVAGRDGAAAVVLLELPEGGVPDSTARVLAREETELTPEPRSVVLEPDSLVVPRNGSRHVVLAVELSGGAPTGSRFSARVVPDGIRTVNANSGARDRVTAGEVIASDTASTTVLREGEAFALSENPVRSGSVNFNFAERPRSAAIYTVTGSRVVDLLPRITELSLRWDLTNDAGERVVPGVYLLVIRIGERLIRERLMVLSRAAQSP